MFYARTFDVLIKCKTERNTGRPEVGAASIVRRGLFGGEHDGGLHRFGQGVVDGELAVKGRVEVTLDQFETREASFRSNHNLKVLTACIPRNYPERKLVGWSECCRGKIAHYLNRRPPSKY